MLQARALGVLAHILAEPGQDYRAVIVLEFETSVDAKEAREVIGPSWVMGLGEHNKMLVWNGNYKELLRIRDMLVSYGANHEAFAHNIECSIPLPLPKFRFVK